MLPYLLNWGTISPEFYNSDKKIALHVFNFLLKNEENRTLSIKFISGKIKWYAKHSPKGCSQIIRIDARGQQLSFEILIDLKKTLHNRISKEVQNIKFEIEILTN